MGRALPCSRNIRPLKSNTIIKNLYLGYLNGFGSKEGLCRPEKWNYAGELP